MVLISFVLILTFSYLFHLASIFDLLARFRLDACVNGADRTLSGVDSV